MEKVSLDRIIDVQKIDLEENDISLRPSVWEDYIGQESVKKNLKVFIEAAKLRNECLPDLARRH